MSERQFAVIDRPTLKASQIGRCGELLVQYLLLRHGIESAAMTTDTGIDLVAYSPRRERPVTIQVKTNLRAKPSGGKGPLALGWRVSVNCPAQIVATVHLEREEVWLFTQAEFVEKAQQKSSKDICHLYFYIDQKKRVAGTSASDYDGFRAERRIEGLFGKAPLTARN